MMKLRSKKYFGRSSSKLSNSASNKLKGADQKEFGGNNIAEIKWELRPGGMLVQRRESGQSVGEGLISIRVSTVSQWHDISIESTSTFGKYIFLISLLLAISKIKLRKRNFHKCQKGLVFVLISLLLAISKINLRKRNFHKCQKGLVFVQDSSVCVYIYVTYERIKLRFHYMNIWLIKSSILV